MRLRKNDLVSKSPVQLLLTTPFEGIEKSLFFNQIEIVDVLKTLGHKKCSTANLSRVLRGERNGGTKARIFLRKAVIQKLSIYSIDVQEKFLADFDKVFPSPFMDPIEEANFVKKSTTKNRFEEVVFEQNQVMLDLLKSLEETAGFSFGKDTCLLILRDFHRKES